MAEKRVIEFVADLPRTHSWCCFNTLRERGKHRQCGHVVQETIEGYGFCKHHAEVVGKATAEQPKESK